MAKLVIYTKEAPAHPTDVAINAGQYQPGDVITILDDDIEYTSGDWNTVISYPNATVEQLVHLASPQQDQSQEVIGDQTVTVFTTKRLRMWNADPDQLVALRTAFGDMGPQGGALKQGAVSKIGSSLSDEDINSDPIMEFTSTYFTLAPGVTDPGVIG